MVWVMISEDDGPEEGDGIDPPPRLGSSALEGTAVRGQHDVVAAREVVAPGIMRSICVTKIQQLELDALNRCLHKLTVLIILR